MKIVMRNREEEVGVLLGSQGLGCTHCKFAILNGVYI